MSLFSIKERKMIEHILGEDFSIRWEGVEQKNNTKDIISIANTGLFSSGKSMLFNALLDRTVEERFKVGAAPTTKKGDREKINDSVEIIDTPGINANDADDDEAFHSLMEADIILMVHNIKTGMLDKCEHDWLNRIAGEMDEEEVQKRFVFVCTWVDEAGTKEDKEKKMNEIKRQLQEILNTDIEVWEVSSKRYYTAKAKNKPELAEASKIPQLKKYLLKRAEEYSVVAEKLRKKEISVLCEQTKEILQKEKDVIDKQIKDREKRVCQKYKRERERWKNIFGNFKDYRKSTREILKKLEKAEKDYDACLDAEIEGL